MSYDYVCCVHKTAHDIEVKFTPYSIHFGSLVVCGNTVMLCFSTSLEFCMFNAIIISCVSVVLMMVVTVR